MISHFQSSSRVRPANDGDAEAIANINISAWRAAYSGVMPTDFLTSLNYEEKLNNWRKALTNPGRGFYIVCELDGVVRGFAVFGPARDKDLLKDKLAGELVAINISPEFWSRGLGTAMINHIIQVAQESQWHSLYLWVINSNIRARNLYKHFGFEMEGKSQYNDKLCNRPLHEIRYVKRLKRYAARSLT